MDDAKNTVTNIHIHLNMHLMQACLHTNTHKKDTHSITDTHTFLFVVVLFEVVTASTFQAELGSDL